MDLERLSKEVSYALRHAPWEYELELDAEGFVDLRQLLDALREETAWEGLKEDDLIAMIVRSEKKRHEIAGGKIRALYGHSLPQRISRTPAAPPENLYHGTARRFLPAIREQGLRPQGRQYVHLSADIETAVAVGKRRDDKPALLVVRALEAWNRGVPFYQGNEKVWLADAVPGEYIRVD